MAIPGSSLCTPRPGCLFDYDVTPYYQHCINGKRLVENRVRAESFCDRTIFVFSKQAEEKPCASCNPGSYVLNESPSNCAKCNDGEYTNTTNAMQCKTCPAGSHSPKAVIYKNLEVMPTEFQTYCERVVGEILDTCSILKGWIVAQGKFTVLPFFPGRVQLILKTSVNITDRQGRIEFNYVVKQATPQVEGLKIRIDGIATGNK